MRRSDLPSQLAKRPKLDSQSSNECTDIYAAFRLPDSGRIGGLIALGLNPNVSTRPLHSPVGPNAFVLFSPPDPNPDELVHVVVDPRLSRVLRKHQKEGVQFLWECTTGIRNQGNYGAIMADEMGLGKTLQVITVLWTLLRQSPSGKPQISNAVIIAPASLIGNWDAEIQKWLGPNAVRTMTVGSGTQAQVYQKLSNFVTAPIVSGKSQTPILIISYESYRSHSDVLSTGEIGLVVCDEGHRLKNQENQTYQALAKIKTKRRIIITGTPIQNDLSEYFSLVNFVSEGLLGQIKNFRKSFEIPIMKSKESSASKLEKQNGLEATRFLMNVVDRCMIRRTAEVNLQYLPQKIELFVCCKMQKGQLEKYKSITQEAIANKGSRFAALGQLRKVVNHPGLLEEGLPRLVEPEESGKLSLLDSLIEQARSSTTDKFVIVSNFTKTLDLLAKHFRTKNYGLLRLDGGMSAKARTKVVDTFNNSNNKLDFILLLSSKAGGCGLNLIGGNRLVMFDPDWNPANDAQAMARVWREGQKKICFVYRLVSTGTLEERIIQRQASKKSLSSSLIDHDESETIKTFDAAELKRLFEFNPIESSILHETLDCKRCTNGVQLASPPPTATVNSDLQDWHHSFSGQDVPDAALRRSFNSSVSFVAFQYSHFPNEN